MPSVNKKLIGRLSTEHQQKVLQKYFILFFYIHNLFKTVHINMHIGIFTCTYIHTSTNIWPSNHHCNILSSHLKTLIISLKPFTRVESQTQPYLSNSQLLFTFWNQILAAVSMVTVTSQSPQWVGCWHGGRCQGKTVCTRHLCSLQLLHGVQCSSQNWVWLATQYGKLFNTNPHLRRGTDIDKWYKSFFYYYFSFQ